MCAGSVPGSLPASQAELEGPCWGWRVQASPLPSPAYWSMLVKKEGGGNEREGEKQRPQEKGKRRRKRGGNRQTATGKRGGGGDDDVAAEREVEKVNPEQECERNAGHGGVFLWLEREKERRRVDGRVGGPGNIRQCKILL